MTALAIIKKKRDGLANTAEEIRYMVRGALDGAIPEYQIAAWLMALYLCGMDGAETLTLTEAFVQSGSVVDFRGLSLPRVDKHSTGGVGDKTSLVVAPVVAAAGLAVPMISGRALGHTGGTLDKIESIPGFKTDLARDAFRDVVSRTGLAVIGATRDLAPADRLFYSLRDMTATIESVPLIVSSIISKKVAGGIEGLCLDVKTGCGAFMRERSEAVNLARQLVQTGRQLGQSAVALISDMSQPLGRKVGNALEVEEAIETLQGEGPDDLNQLCLELAAQMILIGGRAQELGEARALARRALESGRALEKFIEMVEAQGGHSGVVKDRSLLARSSSVFEYAAESSGYLGQVRADILGRAALLLGAGRQRAGDSVNPAVGLTLHKKIGDRVRAGEAILRLHYDEEEQLNQALKLVPSAYRVDSEPAGPPALIKEVIH